MAKVESISSDHPVVVQPGEGIGRQDSQVITHQVSKVQGYPQNVRQWSTQPFSCCDDMKRCCHSCWCYPCLGCKVAGRLDECKLGPCFLGTPFLSAMRSKLRAEYGIQGTVLNDCCMSLWCSFCTMTQIDRELDHLGHAGRRDHSH